MLIPRFLGTGGVKIGDLENCECPVADRRRELVVQIPDGSTFGYLLETDNLIYHRYEAIVKCSGELECCKELGWLTSSRAPVS